MRKRDTLSPSHSVACSGSICTKQRERCVRTKNQVLVTTDQREAKLLREQAHRCSTTCTKSTDRERAHTCSTAYKTHRRKQRDDFSRPEFKGSFSAERGNVLLPVESEDSEAVGEIVPSSLWGYSTQHTHTHHNLTHESEDSVAVGEIVPSSLWYIPHNTHTP